MCSKVLYKNSRQTIFLYLWARLIERSDILRKLLEMVCGCQSWNARTHCLVDTIYFLVSQYEATHIADRADLLPSISCFLSNSNRQWNPNHPITSLLMSLLSTYFQFLAPKEREERSFLFLLDDPSGSDRTTLLDFFHQIWSHFCHTSPLTIQQWQKIHQMVICLAVLAREEALSKRLWEYGLAEWVHASIHHLLRRIECLLRDSNTFDDGEIDTLTELCRLFTTLSSSVDVSNEQIISGVPSRARNLSQGGPLSLGFVKAIVGMIAEPLRHRQDAADFLPNRAREGATRCLLQIVCRSRIPSGIDLCIPQLLDALQTPQSHRQLTALLFSLCRLCDFDLLDTAESARVSSIPVLIDLVKTRQLSPASILLAKLCERNECEVLRIERVE